MIRPIHPAAARLLALSFLTVALGAQDPRPASRPQQPEPPAESKALTALLAADADYRPRALQEFIEEQIATNAVYAGQFAGLIAIRKSAVPLLEEWITKPPRGVRQAIPYRIACISALRDVVEKASDDLSATLRGIADEDYGSDQLTMAAMFALAQFGDRERVDKLIASLRKRAEHEDPREQYDALARLSDTYYNLREHATAIEVYDRFIELIKGLDPQPAFPTIYYNRACSLALLGRIDDAMAGLEEAFEEGVRVGRQLSRGLVESDRDIATLRADPRFAPLLAKYLDTPGK